MVKLNSSSGISSNVILTEERLQEVVDYVLKQDAFAIDCEAQGNYRGFTTKCDVSWISIATYGLCVVIPMGHPIGSKIIGEYKEPRTDKNGKVKYFRMPIYDEPPEQMTPGKVFSILRSILLSKKLIKVTHGGTYDHVAFLKYLGQFPEGPYEDTMVREWMIDENVKKFGLKPTTDRRYKHHYDDENVARCVEKYPFNKIARYAYFDAKFTWLHYLRQEPLIEGSGVKDLYYDLEVPVMEVLFEMSRIGAPINKGNLEKAKVELTKRLVEIESEVYKAAGQRFNINSPMQKQRLLYGPKSEGGQGLKPWKLTKKAEELRKEGAPPMEGLKGWSTDADALESYPNNELAQWLLKYNKVHTCLATFVIGMLGDPEAKDKPCRILDGRIHANFKQYGTDTGRFSCSAPNLTNIMRPDTELGRTIRSAFEAEKGTKLIVADYNQIEYVVLAHYAGEGRLFDGFWEGFDPHTVTAAAVLGKKLSEVTKDERQLFGKTLNFAVTYGVGIAKLSNMLNMSHAETKKILQLHRREFPEIYTLKNDVIATCRQKTFVTTLLGRRRRLPQINYADDQKRTYAERQAFNALMQGGNADILKTAMVRVHRMIKGQMPVGNRPAMVYDDIHLILSVHDEIMLQATDEMAEIAAELLKEAMLGSEMQALLSVPLKAEVKIVSNWANAK